MEEELFWINPFLQAPISQNHWDKETTKLEKTTTLESFQINFRDSKAY